MSLLAPCRIINIGNSNPVNLNIFIEEIENKLKTEAIKNYVEIQPGDVEKTWSNVNLLKSLIGFEPKTSIKLFGKWL